jgi:hypothetical protein
VGKSLRHFKRRGERKQGEQRESKGNKEKARGEKREAERDGGRKRGSERVKTNMYLARVCLLAYFAARLITSQSVAL